MTEVPITPERLRFVLDHLWPRGEEELRQLGLTKEQAYAEMWSFVQNGLRSACLEFDGVPVTVGGTTVDEDGVHCTWFQATSDFCKHAADITGFLLDEHEKYPEPVRIYSVCVHKDAAKWFRILGFKLTDWQRELPSGAVLRRFERA